MPPKGAPVEIEQRKGREGSRWFNERPSAEEVAEWFVSTVQLAEEGLEHAHYLPGVTLIPGKEKSKEPAGFNDKGYPQIAEVEHLVFTPYIKIETRVQYFHDLMALNQQDWLGVIEPVEPREPDPKLPAGFSRYTVLNGEGKKVSFVICTAKVTVFKRETVKVKEVINQRTGEKKLVRTGETIIDAEPATKAVPVLGRFGPDENALEKAETGAVGRALGMAGMLVVPGTGIATAEDMRELAQASSLSPTAREEGAPAPEGRAALDASLEPSQEELVVRAEALVLKLKEASQDAFTVFLAWCKESGYAGVVKEMDSPKLKGLIKKLERDLEAVGEEKG